MGRGLDFSVFFDQISFLIDDEGGTLNAHVFPAVHALFLQHAVKVHHFFFSIGKEREIQLIFIPEISVLLHRVPAHTDDSIAQGFEIRQVVTESLGFQGAA